MSCYISNFIWIENNYIVRGKKKTTLHSDCVIYTPLFTSPNQNFNDADLQERWSIIEIKF